MLVALLALDKPLQAHFGELDNYESFSDAASADQLERQIRAAPGVREVFRYPGVSHTQIFNSLNFRMPSSGMYLTCRSL